MSDASIYNFFYVFYIFCRITNAKRVSHGVTEEKTFINLFVYLLRGFPNVRVKAMAKNTCKYVELERVGQELSFLFSEHSTVMDVWDSGGLSMRDCVMICLTTDGPRTRRQAYKHTLTSRHTRTNDCTSTELKPTVGRTDLLHAYQLSIYTACRRDSRRGVRRTFKLLDVDLHTAAAAATGIILRLLLLRLQLVPICCVIGYLVSVDL